MPKLDFSGINRIAYKGFEDQEERDALIDQGFTVVEENPFSGPQDGLTSTGAAEPCNPQPQSKSPSDRLKRAFTDSTGKRNYKTLYRLAHDFHVKHHPPTVDLAYWKDHKRGMDDTPTAEVEYWRQTARDAAELTGKYQDPFLTGLICTVYEELEREYKTMTA